jgi:hypothetical protein
LSQQFESNNSDFGEEDDDEDNLNENERDEHDEETGVGMSGGEDDNNRSDEETNSGPYRHNQNHQNISNGSMFSKNFYKLLSQNNLHHHLPYSTHSPNGSASSSSPTNSKQASEMSKSSSLGKKAAVQVLVKENEQNEAVNSELGNNHAQMLLSSLNAAAMAANNGASQIDTFNALNALNMAQMLAAQAQHPGATPQQQSQALAALTSFYNNCSSKNPNLDLINNISPISESFNRPNVSPVTPPPQILPNSSSVYQRNYLEALRFYKTAYVNQNINSNAANTAN